ncbi:MAG: hypothetical protein ACOC5L_03205 [Halobacteriota archaeon]
MGTNLTLEEKAKLMANEISSNAVAASCWGYSKDIKYSTTVGELRRYLLLLSRKMKWKKNIPTRRRQRHGFKRAW